MKNPVNTPENFKENTLINACGQDGIESSQVRNIQTWNLSCRGIDPAKRGKVYYSICIYMTFIAIGCFAGQIGPALLDIQSITGVGLDQGSWIVTSGFIGYTIGTLLNGILFHRSNIAVMYSVCLMLLCGGILSIPLCSTYELTVAIFLVTGFLKGLLDTAGNTEIIRVWKNDAQTSLIILHLCFYFGSIISPVYTAPFLMNTYISNKSLAQVSIEYTTEKWDYGNVADVTTHIFNTPKAVTSKNTMAVANGTNQAIAKGNELFFVPFAVTAVFTAFVSLMFLVYIFFLKNQYTSDAFKATTVTSKKVTPKCVKFAGVGSLLGMTIMSSGITNGFLSYLSTFCVKVLNWTKVNGSYVTSVFYIAIVVGDFFGILLSKCLNKTVYVGIQCFIISTSFIILLVSAQMNFTPGIWISSALFGYGKSVVLPLILSWNDAKFTAVTGKMSSLFYLCTMIGAVLNCLFVAYLMDTLSGMWFCYIFLTESFVLIFLYVAASIISCLGNRNLDSKETNELMETDVKIGK